MSTRPILTTGTLAIGLTASPSDQYECQVVNFREEADVDTFRIPLTICPGATADERISGSRYYVQFDYLQDWGETPSLSELLDADAGTELFYTYTPTDTNVPSSAGSFFSIPAAYGGPAGEVWQDSGRMPMNGKPVKTPQP